MENLSLDQFINRLKEILENTHLPYPLTLADENEMIVHINSEVSGFIDLLNMIKKSDEKVDGVFLQIILSKIETAYKLVKMTKIEKNSFVDEKSYHWHYDISELYVNSYITSLLSCALFEANLIKGLN